MSVADLYLLMKNKPMIEIALFKLSIQNRVHYKLSRYTMSQQVIMVTAWSAPQEGFYKLSFTGLFFEEVIICLSCSWTFVLAHNLLYWLNIWQANKFGSYLLRDSAGRVVFYETFSSECSSLLEIALHAALRGLQRIDLSCFARLRLRAIVLMQLLYLKGVLILCHQTFMIFPFCCQGRFFYGFYVRFILAYVFLSILSFFLSFVRICTELIARMGITDVVCIPMGLNKPAYCLCYDALYSYTRSSRAIFTVGRDFLKEIGRDMDHQKRVVLL